MDDHDSLSIERAPDITSQVLLMALVALWGFLSCSATIYLTTLVH
jgi:hypothetical protein